MRMAKGALMWGAAAAMPAAGIAYVVRGRNGALSTLIALGIVLANAAAAAIVSAFAGKRSALGAAAISMPSFAVRMAAILAALGMLKNASFVDEPTFALTFGLAVTAVLHMEAKAWKRTPWVAMTFDKKPTLKEQP